MIAILFAFVSHKLTDAIHRRFVFSDLIFDDLWRLQFMLLPSKTTFNRSIQYPWKFLDEFIAKCLILFFSAERPIERNCFDAAPNPMISIVDLWQTIRGQP